MRCRQAYRAGAHHGDLIRQLGALVLFDLQRSSGFRAVTLGEKALEGADGNGFVDGSAAASGFAGMGADAAADTGQRVGIARIAVRLLKSPFGNQGDVAPGVGSRRARHHTRKIGFEPEPVHPLVREPMQHPEISYLESEKSASALASPATLTGLVCDLKPSCQPMTE